MKMVLIVGDDDRTGIIREILDKEKLIGALIGLDQAPKADLIVEELIAHNEKKETRRPKFAATCHKYPRQRSENGIMRRKYRLRKTVRKG